MAVGLTDDYPHGAAIDIQFRQFRRRVVDELRVALFLVVRQGHPGLNAVQRCHFVQVVASAL